MIHLPRLLIKYSHHEITGERKLTVCEIQEKPCSGYIHPISGAGCLEIMLSVWQGFKDSDLSLIENLDNLTSLGQSGLSLSDELNTLLLGLLLSGVVGLNALDESLVASTLADMLNSNVDSLAELLSTVNLGDLNTDG